MVFAVVRPIGASFVSLATILAGQIRPYFVGVTTAAFIGAVTATAIG